eukprot:GHRQ01017673.1.p1 GENE.GHRQ01017673.1~~GHRQ01017673.1.p1  ORF type:complete len:218 (+),score=65.81 GHRQ01017673.1:816-1469(+)
MDTAIAQLLGGPAAAQAKAKVFAQLKPLCSQLLFLRGQPEQLQRQLDSLAAAVTAVDPEGLRACFDYVTYPLLFMIESVAAARTPASSGSSSTGPREVAVTVPAMKSDLAAEAALQCALALLLRARGLEQDQVLPVLQAAAGLLALPPGAASEEVGVCDPQEGSGFSACVARSLVWCSLSCHEEASPRPSLLLVSADLVPCAAASAAPSSLRSCSLQ